MKAVNLPAIGQVFYQVSAGFVLHELSDQIQLCKFNGIDEWDILCHYHKQLSVDEIMNSAFNDLYQLTYNGKPCYEKEIVVKYEIQFGEVFESQYEWVVIKRPHGNFLKCLDSGGTTEIPCQDKSIQEIIKAKFGYSMIYIKVGDKACYAYA